MAFVFVGGASNSGTATSSSVTHGLTIGAGDLVVLYVNRNDSITIDNDAGGFTELLQETPPSGETASHALFSKISAGSEPATYTNTLNGNDLFQAIVMVWTSDSDAVVDASVTSGKQSTGSTGLVIEATRNVVISDNALSIVVGGKDRNNGTFTYTSADDSYGDTFGGNGGRYTGAASRIYTTGKTFGSTEDITLSTTGTGEVSDTAYSMHVSFVESSTGTTVNLTGQSITLSQGSLTVTGEAAVALTGQSITASQGTIAVLLPQTVTLTGQSATVSQGTLTVTGQANISLAGQSATASQGALTVTGEALVSLAGQQVTASQGALSVDIGGAVTVNLTGQQIALSQGTITPTGEALVNLTGQSIASTQGVLTVSIISTPTVVNLTGQEITASDGILGLITANIISLTGQSITLSQGSLTVTGDQPSVPDADGLIVGGSFGVGISITSSFGTGATVKGKL